jgi:hypothetical protein
MQVMLSRVVIVVLLIDLYLIRRCSFLGDWSHPLPLRVTLSRLDQSDMLTPLRIEPGSCLAISFSNFPRKIAHETGLDSDLWRKFL